MTIESVTFQLSYSNWLAANIISLFAEMHYRESTSQTTHRPVELLGSRFGFSVSIVYCKSIVWLDILVVKRRAPDTLNYCSTQNTENIKYIRNGCATKRIRFLSGNVVFTFMMNADIATRKSIEQSTC